MKTAKFAKSIDPYEVAKQLFLVLSQTGDIVG